MRSMATARGLLLVGTRMITGPFRRELKFRPALFRPPLSVVFSPGRLFKCDAATLYEANPPVTDGRPGS